jgi:hypothetical protein
MHLLCWAFGNVWSWLGVCWAIDTSAPHDLTAFQSVPHAALAVLVHCSSIGPLVHLGMGPLGTLHGMPSGVPFCAQLCRL